MRALKLSCQVNLHTVRSSRTNESVLSRNKRTLRLLCVNKLPFLEPGHRKSLPDTAGRSIAVTSIIPSSCWLRHLICLRNSRRRASFRLVLHDRCIQNAFDGVAQLKTSPSCTWTGADRALGRRAPTAKPLRAPRACKAAFNWIRSVFPSQAVARIMRAWWPIDAATLSLRY